ASRRLRVDPSEMTRQGSSNELVETHALACSGPHEIRVQTRRHADNELPGVGAERARRRDVSAILKRYRDPAKHGIAYVGDGFFGGCSLADATWQFLDLGYPASPAGLVCILDDLDRVGKSEIVLSVHHPSPPRSQRSPFTRTPAAEDSADRSSAGMGAEGECRPNGPPSPAGG